MLNIKKSLGVIIAFAVVLAMAIPAMAYDVDETSKSVPGYGTLYGTGIFN